MISVRELGYKFGAKTYKKTEKNFDGGSMGFDSDSQLLTIKFPEHRALKVVARCMLVALVIVSFPWIISHSGDFFHTDQPHAHAISVANNLIDSEQLPMIFNDLMNKGLLKLGDRALSASDGDMNNGDQIYNSQILNNDIYLVSVSDFDRQNSISDNTFDFAFTNGFKASAVADFIDRTLKIGGVAAVQLTDDSRFLPLTKPSNHEIVYVQRYESTIITALMKTKDHTDSKVEVGRRLLGFGPEEKNAALKKLEDVLLEPPRAKSGKSSRYMKKTRYLPDLMGDSLESYPRRVFIDVGGDDTAWFTKHYPTRKKDFEVYKIGTVAAAEDSKLRVVGELSEWVRRNVREEEYVVMKAEAEAVEEMVKNEAIRLVDELFLECKPHEAGSRRDGTAGGKSRGRRAYWECLALYGHLRDEGVAVHQWWG